LQSSPAAFGNLQAVDDLSLTVPAGQIVGLIGPNGSGKSTLLSLISATLPADSGQVIFAGQDITRKTPAEIFQACVDHLRLATNGGRIRPVMTVFAADGQTRHRPRIWNPQLIRYAGWRRPDGTVLGDPSHIEFTELLESLGWKPNEKTATA